MIDFFEENLLVILGFILFFSILLSVYFETHLVKIDNHVYKKSFHNVVCLDCCK